MDVLAQYTFLPWLRQGMANHINEPDNLSTADSNIIERASVTMSLELAVDQSQIQTVNKTIKITGPGDVVGINESAIVKVEPINGTFDFENNYLPYIEFYDEDFPWRYTPAKANGDKLRPWLHLLALKNDEFEFDFDPANPLPVIHVNSDAVFQIPPEDIWAWAHVHINRRLEAAHNDATAIRSEIISLLEEDPDIAVSRLICPRQLEGNTEYTMFLVPAFETGRLAGLGNDITGLDAMTPAWSTSDVSKSFPVYHQWRFSTVAGGDFETLSRLLTPVQLDHVELSRVNIEDLEQEFSDQLTNSQEASKTLEFDAALMPIDRTLEAWPSTGNAKDTEIKTVLREQINLGLISEANPSEDPIVNTPPAYGQWHAAINELTSNTIGWVEEVNLDPRRRGTAGLGTEVVQKQQEELMDYAWEQVGEILEANQSLRQAQLAKEVNRAIQQKHLVSRSEEQIIAATSNLHGRIRHNDVQNNTTLSIEHRVKISNLTKAGTKPSFKKVMRPNGKTAKKINGQLTSDIGLNENIERNLNSDNQDKITAAIPKPTPYGTYNQDDGSLNTGFSLDTDGILDALDLNINATGVLNRSELETTKATEAIIYAIQPERSVAKSAFVKFKLPVQDQGVDTPQSDWLKPVMAYPDIPQPAYKALKDLSQDFILPGISDIANNSISLVQTNPAFIEAFMLGLNHEMARELLWREYPTDQRGTYFKRFWDHLDSIDIDGNDWNEGLDISPIHTWRANSGLGTHPADGDSSDTVLMIRGDLLRKYPDTIIYAQKAEWQTIENEQVRVLADQNIPTNIKFPIFRAHLEPDISIIGFDLTPAQAKGENINQPGGPLFVAAKGTGSTPTPPSDAGWFFILKERSGEVRFGLDSEIDSPTTTVENWDDLSWSAMSNNYVDVKTTINNEDTSNTVNWGQDASHMANILYQVPVMIGIHATDMLPQ